MSSQVFCRLALSHSLTHVSSVFPLTVSFTFERAHISSHREKTGQSKPAFPLVLLLQHRILLPAGLSRAPLIPVLWTPFHPLPRICPWNLHRPEGILVYTCHLPRQTRERHHLQICFPGPAKGAVTLNARRQIWRDHGLRKLEAPSVLGTETRRAWAWRECGQLAHRCL